MRLNNNSILDAGLQEEGKYSVTVDILAVRLEHMVISDKDVVPNEQNALVPYKGDGTIIPFEGYDLTKKRKPRPKVDLDPETSRIWDLLMGKEGSENTQTMDKDKEKWWEEERGVFRGRADSFIARMHLVQGIIDPIYYWLLNLNHWNRSESLQFPTVLQNMFL